MMHWIQKHALRKLAVAEILRYKELKPTDVEGNTFMYHLDRLVKEKLIEKSKDGYRLTSKGKTFVSSMSLQAGERKVQPKIVVMLDCMDRKGQQLLFKWRRQPYYGLVSLPFSKIHFGSSTQHVAEEELKNKSGLRGEFKYRGDIYIQTLENGQTADHMLAHVFSVEDVSGELLSGELNGKAFWGDPKDFNESNTVAGFERVLKLLKTKKTPFFEEIACNLD